MTAGPVRRGISVRGIVQGVGYRPFVYALAHHCRLSGLVQNDAQGVHVEVEGPRENVELFLQRIEAEAPPLAVVERVTWQPLAVRGEREFRIAESVAGAHRQALVSPDVAVCEACLGELFAPGDRRYRYPFINCTNCGPRFTIARAVPYDRATTTMQAFTMCAACRREYDDPTDRRFHAQPNACPVCGPTVRFTDPAGRALPLAAGDAISQAAALLRSGAIVAIKGLGGYHLACDPFNPAAVATLRRRKAREDRPFALMVRTVVEARALCRVTPAGEALLMAPARPIVLLERRDGPPGDGAAVAPEVAPRQKTLGIMLAYTPLHHLLLHDMGGPLVMTSGNRSSEPIAYRDDEAFAQLDGIADYFLLHDRPIHTRCDDSVVRVSPTADEGVRDAQPYPQRRSRGYAPAPLRVVQRFDLPTLACGGQLKNTFCLARERQAFVSHHIGDLENYETLRSYKEGIAHYGALFDLQPRLVACDLHPGYLSTQYAHEQRDAGLPLVEVQHHHAHIAACLADNERPATERVIGVAFDGTGYGSDGTIWGGEFFTGSIAAGFRRRVHLEYAPLPGGEAAIRRPWRSAAAFLAGLFTDAELEALPLPLWRQIPAPQLRVVRQLLAADLPGVAPRCSSAGRLFDTVAALVGVPGSLRTTYEGQAAIELEAACSGASSADLYPVELDGGGGALVLDPLPALAAVLADLRAGVPVGTIAARFHAGVAAATVSACVRACSERRCETVVLSGGVFANRLLLEATSEGLERHGLRVLVPERLPAGDGGIAYGQVAVAAARRSVT